MTNVWHTHGYTPSAKKKRFVSLFPSPSSFLSFCLFSCLPSISSAHIDVAYVFHIFFFSRVVKKKREENCAYFQPPPSLYYLLQRSIHLSFSLSSPEQQKRRSKKKKSNMSTIARWSPAKKIYASIEKPLNRSISRAFVQFPALLLYSLAIQQSHSHTVLHLFFFYFTMSLLRLQCSMKQHASPKSIFPPAFPSDKPPSRLVRQDG